MKPSFIVGLVAIVLAPVSGRASVLYTLSDPVYSQVGVTYTAPALITQTETIPAGSLSSCFISGGSCVSVTFNFLNATTDDFQLTTGQGVANFFFDASAFGNFGVHDTNSGDNAAVLTVSSTSVPEPATWALLAAGIGLLLAVPRGLRSLRRSRRQLTA